MYVSMYICIMYVSMYICMYVCIMYVCMYVSMYICIMYVCMYVCTHVRVCVGAQVYKVHKYEIVLYYPTNRVFIHKPINWQSNKTYVKHSYMFRLLNKASTCNGRDAKM
jgi:hypothetical protein